MWYIFILLFFRILALENIAKILTTGPRLGVITHHSLTGEERPRAEAMSEEETDSL